MTLARAARPVCDPDTLMDERCVGGCGRRLHRGDRRTHANCREDHPAHIGRGLCSGCRVRARNRGELGDFPTLGDRLSRDHDHALDEWAHVRGYAQFDTFGPRVGLSQSVWVRLFQRAAGTGDPRATRPVAS